MDKIEASYWPDVFSQNDLSIPYSSERYTETLYSFGEPGLARGSSLSIATPDMKLTRFSIAPERILQLKDAEGSESAESVFILEGNVRSSFPGYKSSLQFGKEAHSLQYNTHFAGEHIIYPGLFSAMSITYDLDFLRSILQSAGSRELDILCEHIACKKSLLAFPDSIQWNFRVKEVVHAILHCSFTGITKYIFIESKMMELLSLQLEEMNKQPSANDKWSRQDIEKLQAVKAYIEQCYLEPATLKEIGLRFQLNEFKLKKGYKALFRTTVFGHIISLRLQKARKLLQDKEMTVTEVAYYIGYKNAGSFSAEFKKRYGYSPIEVGTN